MSRIVDLGQNGKSPQVLLSLQTVKGGAKTITYIGSVVYMCVSLSDGATLFKLPDYQAMAEDPRSSAWSEGRPGVVGSSRFYRVGYTHTIL